MIHYHNSSVETTQARKKGILVVEDDEDIGHMIVETLLQETCYNVCLAESGRDALRAVREIKPDLFLLDYNLPSMSGIVLYDQLHSMKELEGIPAIMMSAAMPLDELKKRGIIPLHKPFDLDELLNTIESVLAR